MVAVRVALAVTVLAAVGGCRARGPDSPEALAEALSAAGLSWEVSETAVLGSIAADGLRLRGPELAVELYLVRGRREQKLAGQAALIAAAAAREADQPAPQVLIREPFIVVVRVEPEPGAVRRALERALGE